MAEHDWTEFSQVAGQAVGVIPRRGRFLIGVGRFLVVSNAKGVPHLALADKPAVIGPEFRDEGRARDAAQQLRDLVAEAMAVWARILGDTVAKRAGTRTPAEERCYWDGYGQALNEMDAQLDLLRAFREAVSKGGPSDGSSH